MIVFAGTQPLMDLTQQGYVQVKTGSSSSNLLYVDLNSQNTAQNGHSGFSDIENQNNNSSSLPPDYIEQKQNYQYNRVNSLRNMRSNSYKLSPEIESHSRKNSGTNTPVQAPDTVATESSAVPPSPLRPVVSQPSGPRQNQYSPVPIYRSPSQRSIGNNSQVRNFPTRACLLFVLFVRFVLILRTFFVHVICIVSVLFNGLLVCVCFSHTFCLFLPFLVSHIS